VVMPDYQGFGDSIVTHPYVHLSLGNSVKDSVLWAQGYFKNRTVNANGIVYLTGYSEGGYTTMAGALKLQQVESSTLRLAGITSIETIPCDGAYDLSGTMLTQMLSKDPIKVPSYLLYTASGYVAAEPTMPALDTLLAGDWDIIAGAYFDGRHTNAEVSKVVPAAQAPFFMLGSQVAADLGTKPIPTGPVYPLLVKNNAWYGWDPDATKPVFVHCMADDVVPYTNATVAAELLGSEIRWVAPIPFVAAVMGSIHVGAYPTAMLEAFKIIRGN